MKDKCIAIVQASYYINYYLITKLRHESEKTHGMALASPRARQTRGLASNFKACQSA